MKIIVLGRGKTGSLVAEVARERGHAVEVLCAADNPGGSALTPERLADVGAVIDFTVPNAVLDNIRDCARAGKNMVVGKKGFFDFKDVWREL